MMYRQVFILIHLISLARKKKITVSLSQLTAASCMLSTKMSSKRFKKKKKKARQRIKRRSSITSWCKKIKGKEKKKKKKIRKKKFHVRPSGSSQADSVQAVASRPAGFSHSFSSCTQQSWQVAFWASLAKSTCAHGQNPGWWPTSATTRGSVLQGGPSVARFSLFLFLLVGFFCCWVWFCFFFFFFNFFVFQITL